LVSKISVHAWECNLVNELAMRPMSTQISPTGTCYLAQLTYAYAYGAAWCVPADTACAANYLSLCCLLLHTDRSMTTAFYN